jgi:hypothetical protein
VSDVVVVCHIFEDAEDGARLGLDHRDLRVWAS